MTINALELLPIKTASCSVMGDWSLKKKMTVPYSKAKKGDVVLFDFNHNGTSDHIGIIYKVNGNKIYTVEGNTGSDNCNGGAVMKRVRTKGVVNYIIRPKYGKSVTADMICKTALSQVGVKEKPKNSNRVRYNTWFYGKEVSGAKYPWCCTFVCWVFAHVMTKSPKSKADKIIATIDKLAYPKGTPAKTWGYSKGHARKSYRNALLKYMHKKARISQSDCGYFVSTVVRMAGIDKDFLALKGTSDPFPKSNKFKVVFSGKKIPADTLKKGDIIRYKKTNGGQHTFFYYGHGKIAEAGRGSRFPAIKKDKHIYNKSNVKHGTLQVLRAKG